MNKDYLSFFGLNDNPFKPTPDTDYFFLSETHKEALTSLHYLVKTTEGFAVIVGEPGTGKTITIRKFLEDTYKSPKYKCAYITFPTLEPKEFFEAVLEDLGIEFQNKQVTKNKLFKEFQNFLIEEYSKGFKVLIIVDEAQNLPEETLEELRLFSNLETKDSKLIQIILLGQEELLRKINKLPQLKQRINIFVKLRNLSLQETIAYINYKLSLAGKGEPQISEDAYKIIYKYSRGNPRVINSIMERALMAAYIDNSKTIKKEHIVKAFKTLNIKNEENIGEINLKILNKKSIFLFIILSFFVIFIGITWNFYLKNKYNVENLYTFYKSLQKNINNRVAKQENINNRAAKQENINNRVAKQENINNRAAKQENINNRVAKQENINNRAANLTKSANTAHMEFGDTISMRKYKQKLKATIKTSMLNVREEPSINSDVIYVLERGEVFYVLGEGPNPWVRVEIEIDDLKIEGWVNGKYIKYIKD